MAIKLDAVGNLLEISYLEPPPALRELGVTEGTVLVHGKWQGAPPDVLEGEAFAFSADCPPQPFKVRGVVDQSGALVVLGPAPASCHGPLEWNAASVMRFESPMPAESNRPQKSKEKPKAKVAAKPKPKPKPRPQPQPQPSLQPRYDWREWQWR